MTGKLTLGHDISGSRFAKGSEMAGSYQSRYDRPVMHEAIKTLHSRIEPLGLTLPEVSLRWLAYHSVLDEKDGIILGGSSTSQIERNLDDIARGPLPDRVVGAVEEMWKIVKAEAP